MNDAWIDWDDAFEVVGPEPEPPEPEQEYAAYCIIYDANGNEVHRTTPRVSTSPDNTFEQMAAIDDAEMWIIQNGTPLYNWELVQEPGEPDDWGDDA